MKIKKNLCLGTLLFFPILFFCTTVDFSDIDDLVNKPTLVIAGDNPDTISVGDSWSKPTVVASDANGVDLSDDVTSEGSVNTDEPGTYEIIFKVKSSNDVEVAETLVVVVKEKGDTDTEPPVITISGDNPVTITVGDNWSEPAVTATDNVDGDLTTSITKTGDEVKTGTVGEYKITYKVTDAAGNEATKVLTVIVKEKDEEDNTPPEITISGDNPDTIKVGQKWEQPTVTAIDNVDGDISVNVTSSGTVDNSKVGTNEITYSVSDAAGNTASKKLIVYVKEDDGSDTEPPVITISGNNPDTIKVGDSWSNPEATAEDNIDGTISFSNFSVTGEVDNTKAGTYKLTYTVSDAAGNSASKILTVVVEDNTVVLGDSLLIEDFEAGEKGQIALWEGVNYDDGWWYGYKAGSSTIEPETTDSINMDEKVADSAAHNGSLGLYAKITLNGSDYPSAMVGFSLKTSEQFYDLSQVDSITLYMKGSGKINVYLETKYVSSLGTDAWGHYGKDVNLSNSWERITIPKDQLKASPDNPKIEKEWNEVSNEVTAMGFEVTGAKDENGGTVVEVYIDDIWFHGIKEIK